LADYDYSQNGWYFITICTHDRIEYFGVIKNGEMVLNEFGKIVRQCWLDLPNHYKNCELGVWVIMPNHFHGIITIGVGNGLKPFPTTMASDGHPDGLKLFPTASNVNTHGLSEIIRGFKTFSSRRINERVGKKIFNWQKSFYDRIVRDKNSLERISNYIENNPENWEIDRNNLWMAREKK
jgi:REP element-mobilizing transposase RayT